MIIQSFSDKSCFFWGGGEFAILQLYLSGQYWAVIGRQQQLTVDNFWSLSQGQGKGRGHIVVKSKVIKIAD